MYWTLSLSSFDSSSSDSSRHLDGPWAHLSVISGSVEAKEMEQAHFCFSCSLKLLESIMECPMTLLTGSELSIGSSLVMGGVELP